MRKGQIYARITQLECLVALDLGVPRSKIRALGLDLDALSEPEATVEGDLVYRLMECIHTHVLFTDFVLEVARRYGMSSTGPVGMAAKSMPTVREGIACFVRYQHLVNGLMTIEVLEQEDTFVWTEHRYGTVSLGSQLATELNIINTAGLFRKTINGMMACAIEIPRIDADVSRYEDVCGAPVRIKKSPGRIIYDAAWLASSTKDPDPEMVAYFEHLFEKASTHQPNAPAVALDVRRAVSRRLAKGAPSIDEVAKSLKTSRRSLQRRLKEEDLTFAQVVETLRWDLAQVYLEQPHVTISEIAYLLGYTDARSFHRAFRRWTGTTAQVFRTQYSS